MGSPDKFDTTMRCYVDLYYTVPISLVYSPGFICTVLSGGPSTFLPIAAPQFILFISALLEEVVKGYHPVRKAIQISAIEHEM